MPPTTNPSAAASAPGAGNRYLPNVPFPFDGDDTWNLAGILKDIKNGCAPNEKKRAEAQELQDWYEGDSEKFISFKPSEDSLSWLSRPKRVSFITRQAVRKLTCHLYKPGPRARRVTADDAVDAWYRRVAADLKLDTLMKRCDELATLQGLCAVGMYATGTPSRPVNYHLYPRTDFDYWTDPKDPRLPVAVCTVTKIDHETTRFRLWTNFAYYTFFKSKSWGNTAGGWGSARYDLAQSGPHGYGALPFVLVTHELPTTSLEIKGLGHLLAKINRALNIDKSNLAHWIHHYGRPLGFLTGVGADYRPQFLVGGFVVLPPRQTSSELSPVTASATYLQANLDIAALRAWVVGEANSALAEVDVPLTMHVQSDGGGGTMGSSGLALESSAADLITYAKGRQPIFDVHESKILALACRAGAHPDAHQPDALKARLLAVAADPNLRCVWPEVYSDLPSRDRDDSDTWELAGDLTDPIELFMKRQGLTEPEAIDAFTNVQRRKVIAARIVADAQADLDAGADPAGPAEPAAPTPSPTGQDADPGDMGVIGPMAPTGRVAPSGEVDPSVSVTVAVSPQIDIPAGPVMLPATANFGGWGTES